MLVIAVQDPGTVEPAELGVVLLVEYLRGSRAIPISCGM